MKYLKYMMGGLIVVIELFVSSCSKKAPSSGSGIVQGIQKWSGDGRRGNPGDTLSKENPYYAIWVRVLEGGVPKPDKYVTFTSVLDDSLWDGTNTGKTITKKTNAVGRTFIYLISNKNITAKERKVDVTISGTDPQSKFTFTEYVFTDPETTSLGDSTHERRNEGYPQDSTKWPSTGSNLEVKGDGLDDGSDKKTILVECDYWNGNSHFTRDTINQALKEAVNILNSADIEMKYDTLTTADTISQMSDSLDTSDAKKFLASKRTQKERIHIIFGTSRKDGGKEILGATYEYYSQGITRFDTLAYMASSDLHTNYLDSVGIFVFLNALPQTNSNYRREFTRIQYLACVIAHELGHALGLSVHFNDPKYGYPDDAKGVMRSPFPSSPLSASYSAWNFFHRKYLDGYRIYLKYYDKEKTGHPRQFGLNTMENVLGRDVVDIFH